MGWRRRRHIDETDIKVKGKQAYLYRAVDDNGSTIDFYLSPIRNSRAATLYRL